MNHSHAPAIINELWTSLMLSPGVNSRAELVPSPRANARNVWYVR